MRRQVLNPIVNTNAANVESVIEAVYTSPRINSGEIVINEYQGKESLYIRNSHGELVPFASQNYVSKEIAAASGNVVSFIVDSAPEAFDTLKEVADWIDSHSGETLNILSEISDIKGDLDDSVKSVTVDEENGQISVEWNNDRTAAWRIGYYLSIKASSSECTKVGDAYVNEADGFLYLFNGTDFTKSVKIVGADGPQGPQGDQGPMGPQGQRGADGYIGADGPQGDQGPQGNQGAQGPQGDGIASITYTRNESPELWDGKTGGEIVILTTNSEVPRAVRIYDGLRGPQGIAPEFRVTAEGDVEISYDGTTWINKGTARFEQGAQNYYYSTNFKPTTADCTSDGDMSIGDDGIIYEYRNGTLTSTGISVIGPQGPQGDEGRGISSVGITDVTNGKQLDIVLSDGTMSSFTLTNGINGSDGISVSQVEFSRNGHDVTYITRLSNGAYSAFTISDGVDGVTPQLEVRSDRNVYVSYDGGTSWTNLGPAYYEEGAVVTNNTYSLNVKGSQTACTANGDAYIDENGTLQIYMEGSFSPSVNLRGPRGIGVSSITTARTGSALTMTTILSDGTTSAVTVYDGVGIASVTGTSNDGSHAAQTLTIAKTDGSSDVFTYYNGVDGKNGRSIAGISGTVITGNDISVNIAYDDETPNSAFIIPHGLSAYEVWLQTNSGSRADFLNSLIGEKGEQGPQGAKGDQGPIGSTGASGATGQNGRSIIYTNVENISTPGEGYSETTFVNIDCEANDIVLDSDGNVYTVFDNGSGNLKLKYQMNITGSGGSFGPQGPQGPQGAKGDQGNQGPAGANGVNGDQGPQGAKGDQGEKGEQGERGPQGAKGDQGNQGPAGTNGTNGTNGSQGPQGPQGNQGPAGANGTNGTNGSQGPQGPRGPQGNQGPAGVNGTNGTNGADGKSVWYYNGVMDTDVSSHSIQNVDSTIKEGDLVVDNNGNLGVITGTDDDTYYQPGVHSYYLVDIIGSIKGPQGNQGPAGANGTNGTNGTNGNQGPQGPQGNQGPAGANGTNGTNGASGDDGKSVYATSNAPYTTGTQTRINDKDIYRPSSVGDKILYFHNNANPDGSNTISYDIYGITGFISSNNGAMSVSGISTDVTLCTVQNGTQGPQGPAGTNGTNGSQGPQGPAGTNGTNGSQGPAGPSFALSQSSSKHYLIGISAGTGTNTFNSSNAHYETSTWYEAGLLYESSDERLKDFGDDIPIDFNALKEIPKKYFTWKNDADKVRNIGTSAQKLAEYYPEAVSVNDDVYGVSYDRLAIVALAAIDKLHKENEELKERIKRLEESTGTFPRNLMDDDY